MEYFCNLQTSSANSSISPEITVSFWSGSCCTVFSVLFWFVCTINSLLALLVLRCSIVRLFFTCKFEYLSDIFCLSLLPSSSTKSYNLNCCDSWSLIYFFILIIYTNFYKIRTTSISLLNSRLSSIIGFEIFQQIKSLKSNVSLPELKENVMQGNYFIPVKSTVSSLNY